MFAQRVIALDGRQETATISSSSVAQQLEIQQWNRTHHKSLLIIRAMYAAISNLWTSQECPSGGVTKY